MSDDNDLAEVIEDQLQRQGVASFRVDDGHVFVFTTETLEQLLKDAEDGRILVFVKRGVVA